MQDSLVEEHQWIMEMVIVPEGMYHLSIMPKVTQCFATGGYKQPPPRCTLSRNRYLAEECWV